MENLSLNANNRDNHKLRKFDNYIKDGKIVFVMFHMNGCGHCIQALPEWQNIKNKLNQSLKNNNNIVVADIESSNLSNIKNSKNIEGFPTIRYIYNYGDSYEDYNGPREVSEFIKWIESKIPSEKSVSVLKGGRNNKTKKRLPKKQKQENTVDFDIDLFFYKLFTFSK